MKKPGLMLLGFAVALTAACVKKDDRAGSKPEPAPVAKAQPADPPKPAEVAAKPAAEPAKKKGRKVPFGLPQIKALKEEYALENAQLREVRKVYAEYGERLQEAAAKMKAADADGKKELRKEINPLRKEVLEKIVALFTPEQKTKWDAAMEKKRAEAKKRREQQQQ